MNVLFMVDFFSAAADALMCVILCDAFLKRKSNLSAVDYGISYVVLTIAILICNSIFRLSAWNIVGMMLLGMAITVVFQNNIRTILQMALLWILVIGMTEMFSLYFLMFIFDINAVTMVQQTGYRVFGIFLSKLLGLGVCNIIRIKCRKVFDGQNRTYWKIFLLLFSTLIVVDFFMFKVSYEMSEVSENKLAIIASICMTISTVIALFLYEKQEKYEQKLYQQEKQKQQLKMQMKHMDELLVQQEETKRLRHDMQNQLIVLKGYLSKGNLSEGIAYIDRLSHSLVDINISVNTGNLALDAIIGTKKKLAESKGIIVETVIRIPDQILLNSVDIGIIFGNALDNAIEACERCQDKQKKISLFLVQNGSKLLCKISNTVDYNGEIHLNTVKDDKENHGMGVLNIIKTLEKYNSEPIFDKAKGIFTLKFVIFEEC